MMIAGEASGDAHGAGVVRELRRRRPGMDITGIGGDLMRDAGMRTVFHVREMSFMGFVEVIRHLPFIRRVERTLEGLLDRERPDAVVLIDYPGFNLRFARAAKRRGIKVIYYISPQVWAWKKGRVKRMKRFIDRMLVVFPFEVPIYETEGIPVRFVGHPLVEEMKEGATREAFCAKHGLDPAKGIIAVIPGSRKQEVRGLFRTMAAAALVVAGSGRQVAVAVAPNLTMDEYEHGIPDGANVVFVRNDTHDVMKHAEFAFVASGTATLETACSGTPMVVVYRTAPLTYWIARLVIRIRNIALVNIVAGRTVVPELLQDAVTVPALVKEATAILTDAERRETMTKELARVRELLGGPGAAARVADAILTA